MMPSRVLTRTGKGTEHIISERSISTSPAQNSESKGVCDMKVSPIPWHVFLDACVEENTVTLDRWLQRWSFADDGARPSVEPAQYGSDVGKTVPMVGVG